VILVDTNVLMYAAGAPHPNKERSVDFLQRVANGETEAVINAEVLQEILHRYRALNRWEDGARLFDMTRAIFPIVIPVTVDVMDRARTLLDQHPGLMARDGLHAAVVFESDLTAICSFDRDFDAIGGLERMEP
jgi:uncharacterized protein